MNNSTDYQLLLLDDHFPVGEYQDDDANEWVLEHKGEFVANVDGHDHATRVLAERLGVDASRIELVQIDLSEYRQDAPEYAVDAINVVVHPTSDWTPTMHGPGAYDTDDSRPSWIGTANGWVWECGHPGCGQQVMLGHVGHERLVCVKKSDITHDDTIDRLWGDEWSVSKDGLRCYDHSPETPEDKPVPRLNKRLVVAAGIKAPIPAIVCSGCGTVHMVMDPDDGYTHPSWIANAESITVDDLEDCGIGYDDDWIVTPDGPVCEDCQVR